jgi:hypothetical protein
MQTCKKRKKSKNLITGKHAHQDREGEWESNESLWKKFLLKWKKNNAFAVYQPIILTFLTVNLNEI